jgi:hypothetical protein
MDIRLVARIDMRVFERAERRYCKHDNNWSVLVIESENRPGLASGC